MSSISKNIKPTTPIRPILESLGPEILSPNLSQVGNNLYKLFDEIEGTYEVINHDQYEILKKENPANVKNAILMGKNASHSNSDEEERPRKHNARPEPEMGVIKSAKIPEGMIPEGAFDPDIEDIVIEESKESKDAKVTPQLLFERLVDAYFKYKPYVSHANSITPELEIRFGTRGIRPLTKNDYDNVIKKLKSQGFTSIDENGISRLTIKNEYLDKNSGFFKMSSIRTEIAGINQIQKYCKTNEISELVKAGFQGLSFVKKEYARDSNSKPYLVNFDDFNFRVSYENEELYMSKSGRNSYGFITQNWSANKKTFRYINRVTFVHANYPVKIDLSIVKSSDRGNKYRTLDESNLFEKPETYEIEIEIDNKKVGPGTSFNDTKSILDALRKSIKFVLSGLQGTNYPVSYLEQKQTLEKYMSMIYKEKFEASKPVRNNNFIGPNSFTLQLANISPVDENSTAPNVRNDFVVTEKADGERHLMFIDDNGKIYLINTNMKVIFTGAKTMNKDTFNTLIDGELILHDKRGQFLNLFAAFDIYYINKLNVRAYPFMPLKNDKDIYKSRYMLLKRIINMLKPVSVIKIEVPNAKNVKNVKSMVQTLDASDKIISPIKITYKKFLPENQEKGNIFSACFEIINHEKRGLFEYNTDGLIFSHAYFGVGGDAIGKTGPLSKTTWEFSFKWKPPQYNTIDFLVDIVKTQSGEDVIKQQFEPGTNVLLSEQSSSYKMIQLKCTFIESQHGFINPCQDIIDDNLPEYNTTEETDRESKPVQFYPTNPYDADAGICNIMLRKDNNNVFQMFTDDDNVFLDNTIVEFSYDMTREKGWRWVPLRVRHDKTTDMRQNKRNFGNAYHVANSNWQSIHNPVTEDMICTGLNVPDFMVDEDIYYNKPSGILKTEALKNFHNLYVKRTLITSASNAGDTLIDYACGKAGDLPKWISARLAFVFGIDKSKDNLENRLDGACARFLKMKRKTKHMPSALFVHGDSGFNIKNGTGLLSDKAKQTTNALFGVGTSNPEKIGKGVAKHFGKSKDGFNVSSCQFALHYFLENADTLQGFMRNLSECTKLGGYFIGTAYDGKQIFNLLNNKNKGESVQIMEDGKKIWEIVKNYNLDTFESNSSSIGYRVDVYQESINQLISEYLINFDYLDRVLENYGFKLISREEAISIGLPEASGSFSGLYMNMMEEIKKNKYKEKDYGKALNMTSYEKKISFLNKYFVYKKVIMVNAEKVELELGEYNELDEGVNLVQTNNAVEVAKKEVQKTKPKITRLNKRLVLENATEALDDNVNNDTEEQHEVEGLEEKEAPLPLPVNKPLPKKKKAVKPKASKFVIVEDDDEE